MRPCAYYQIGGTSRSWGGISPPLPVYWSISCILTRELTSQKSVQGMQREREPCSARGSPPPRMAGPMEKRGSRHPTQGYPLSRAGGPVGPCRLRHTCRLGSEPGQTSARWSVLARPHEQYAREENTNPSPTPPPICFPRLLVRRSKLLASSSQLALRFSPTHTHHTQPRPHTSQRRTAKRCCARTGLPCLAIEWQREEVDLGFLELFLPRNCDICGHQVVLQDVPRPDRHEWTKFWGKRAKTHG